MAEGMRGGMRNEEKAGMRAGARRAGMRAGTRLGAALALALALAACESAEERAEGHYRDAVTFLEAGDATRAKLEFRNVFDLDPTHRDARAAYAAMLAAEGDEATAYGQYLRLVEQYPEDAEGRRALALMAAARRDWDETRRQAEAGLALAPQDEGLRAAAAAVAYRDAVLAEDAAAEAEAAEAAGAALAAEPALSVARLVAIDHLIRQGREAEALEMAEAGLALEPASRELGQLRLALLARGGDTESLGAALAEAAARAPEDDAAAATYLRFLISEGEDDAAEAFLRGRIDPAAPALEDRAALLEFLRARRGAEAMRAELGAMIAGPAPQGRAILRAMRAALDFEEGRLEAALAEMTDLLAEAEAAGDGTGGADGAGGLEAPELARLHVRLGQMRDAAGDRVGARASIERALAIDPAQPDALKVKAGWLIDADDTQGAIGVLRSALGAAPRDPQVMTLLARAHQRDGDAALAGEMLARAVEVSGSAPEESLRYAQFLAGEGRTGPALAVLGDALALAPGEAGLLSAAGRLHLQARDWTRLEEVAARLRALPGEAGAAEAEALTAMRLSAEERTGELEEMLGRMASGEGAMALGAQTALIRADLAAGDAAGAAGRADALVEAAPEDVERRLLRGALRLATEDPEGGLEDLREAVRLDPESEAARLALVRAIREVEGEAAGVEAAAAAAAEMPQSTALQWLRASDLELAGDLQGAIAVYEAIYALDPDSAVVANNLASLIGLTSEDPAQIARAERVARRLRGSDVPAFRDTYGWLLHRLGRSQEALEHLEIAASGMAEDARVRFHHGAALASAGRAEAARAELEAARALAGRGADGDAGEGVEALTAEIDAALAALPAPAETAPATAPAPAPAD